MRRFVIVAVAGIALFGAGAAALVAWLTRERPLAPTPPPLQEAAPAPDATMPLPVEAAAREQALRTNEGRRRFDAFRRTFASAERSPSSEARLLPALDVLFPRRDPAWSLECRRLVCRLEVEAPAEVWRSAFGENAEVRRQVEQAIFEPDGAGIAFVQLVEARVASGPARPEGERVLDEVEQTLLASRAARACVARGPAGSGAEVRVAVDKSGITYRFGSAVDSAVASCLMREAMPDVMVSASAPADVRRAERVVLVTSRP